MSTTTYVHNLSAVMAAEIRGCVQKCKLIARVLPWIPLHNDERQQYSKAKLALLNIAKF